MSKISIKIVDVDQRTRSVIVKFASEHSLKPVDDYDGLAFSMANFNSITPQEFIETIRPQISNLVAIRDQSEKVMDSIDISQWVNYSTTVNSIEIANIDPSVSSQLFTGLSDPEVIL